MKKSILPTVFRPLLACGLSFMAAGVASADILVSTIAGNVARYRNDGSLVNASFITGLKRPLAILVTNSHIFVTNGQTGTVNKYNHDGSPSKVPFLVNVNGPIGLASDGTALYVSLYSSGRIGKYNLTNGAIIKNNLVTEFSPIQGLHFSNGLLAATLPDTGRVYRYSTTTGSASGAVISTLAKPTAITTDNFGNFYVADSSTGKVAKFDPLFGSINSSFISSVANVTGIAFIGSNLAVVNDVAGKVTLHGPTGALLKDPFIKGLNGPFGIASLPVDTPQVKPTVAVNGKTTLTTTKSSITLKGTAKNATAVQVKVNGGKPVKITKVSPWSLKVNLKKGKNTILVTASGSGGKSKAVKLTVTRSVKKKSAAIVLPAGQ